jgi:HK97 gp10 family phage protein
MATQSAGVKVQGLKSVTRALKAIGAPNEEIKKAGKEAGEIVSSEARGLTPVKTGKLRDSIRVSAKANGAVSVQAGNNRRGKAGVPYANPIHWGWFYDKENFIRKNIMPNPFFSKALGYSREKVLKTYFDNMEKLIQRWTQFAKEKNDYV